MSCYTITFGFPSSTDHCSCQIFVGGCWLGLAHHVWPSECERCQGAHQTPHPGQYPAVLKIKQTHSPTQPISHSCVLNDESKLFMLQFSLLWISSSRTFTFPRCLIIWIDLAFDSHSLPLPPSIPTPNKKQKYHENYRDHNSSSIDRLKSIVLITSWHVVFRAEQCKMSIQSTNIWTNYLGLSEYKPNI